MDKPKFFLLILLAIALLLTFCCEPVQAITEAEVQAQVDSWQGKGIRKHPHMVSVCHCFP